MDIIENQMPIGVPESPKKKKKSNRRHGSDERLFLILQQDQETASQVTKHR